MDKQICPECNEAIDSESQSCPKCGFALKGEGPSNTPEQETPQIAVDKGEATVITVDENAITLEERSEESMSHTKKKRLVFIGIGGVFLLIAIICSAFYLSMPKELPPVVTVKGFGTFEHLGTYLMDVPCYSHVDYKKNFDTNGKSYVVFAFNVRNDTGDTISSDSLLTGQIMDKKQLLSQNTYYILEDRQKETVEIAPNDSQIVCIALSIPKVQVDRLTGMKTLIVLGNKTFCYTQQPLDVREYIEQYSNLYTEGSGYAIKIMKAIAQLRSGLDQVSKNNNYVYVLLAGKLLDDMYNSIKTLGSDSLATKDQLDALSPPDIPFFVEQQQKLSRYLSILSNKLHVLEQYQYPTIFSNTSSNTDVIADLIDAFPSAGMDDALEVAQYFLVD